MADFEVGDIVILPRKGYITVMITEVDDYGIAECEEDENIPVLYSGIKTDNFKYFVGLSADEMVYAGKHVDISAFKKLIKRERMNSFADGKLPW